MNFAPNRPSRMGALFLAAVVLLAAGASAIAADPDASWKGAKVMPRLEAEVKIDGETIDDSRFSIPWIVQDVKGDRLLVGDHRKGWVDQSDVVRLADAPQYYSQYSRSYGFEAWAYGMRAFVRRENGDLLGAIADYDTALRFHPSASTYIGRGLTWDSKKDFRRALADFNQARRLDPQLAVAYNNAAWLKSTCPEERFRGGAEAVELAIRACELTDWREAAYLDTLAAAYAEAGDFDSAIKYQDKALGLNPTNDDLKRHADLFKNHQPYREEKK